MDERKKRLPEIDEKIKNLEDIENRVSAFERLKNQIVDSSGRLIEGSVYH